MEAPGYREDTMMVQQPDDDVEPLDIVRILQCSRAHLYAGLSFVRETRHPH